MSSLGFALEGSRRGSVLLIDFSILAEWFILAMISIIGAYGIAELANLLVTTRAINSITNTTSSAINAIVSVHNTSTIAGTSNSQVNNYAKEKQA